MKNNRLKGSRLLQRFGSFSLLGICKYLFLKLRGKSILVEGSCKACGSCCRSIGMEGRNGWLRSHNAFQEILNTYPEYARFEIIGKDRQGFLLFNCSWCTPEGICRDYQNRLALCCNFPESTLAFAGGRLPLQCGYRLVEGVPFTKILEMELKKRK